MSFELPGKILILIGIVMMILMTVFFIILLKKQTILIKTVNIIISILRKVHLKNAADKLHSKLDIVIENYNECCFY